MEELSTIFRKCIFMQKRFTESTFCKCLFFRTLEGAFQKFNFWLAKVELLGCES